jgi:hypothetical protein
VDDDAAPVLVRLVVGDDDPDDADAVVEFDEEPEDVEPADVEPCDEELVEELEEPLVDPVDEEPRGSASATPGLLAIATPTPSVTANAPTRPT